MAESGGSIDSLELVGNALCLDFANTMNSWRKPEHDYLGDYDGFLGWGLRAGLLDQRAGASLRRRATDNPEAAAAASALARGLRETVHCVFAPLARGGEPRQADLDRMSAAFATAVSHTRLARGTHGYRLDWDLEGDLDAALSPIIANALDLLTSPQIGRVGECPGCGWLFLDTTKNHRRRWCSMSMCGGRAKALRHYRRRTGAETASRSPAQAPPPYDKPAGGREPYSRS